MEFHPPNRSLIERIDISYKIEEIIKSLKITDELAAQVLTSTLARLSQDEQNNKSDFDLVKLVIEELTKTLDSTIYRFPLAKKLENINSSKKLIAVYTGQFNPPTKGHEAFIRNLQKLGFSVIVTGPDSENMPIPHLEEKGESGYTPLKMRRYIFYQWLTKVFPEETLRGEIVLYPKELTGGSFTDRVKSWHEYYKDGLVIFCAGADTLKQIIKWWPQAILSGHIICMKRISEDGSNVDMPIISRNFYIKLMQEVITESADELERIFEDHSDLLDMTKSWCSKFSRLDISQFDDFLTREKISPSDFANRLLGNDRIAYEKPKSGSNIKKNLERFIVYAKLATNLFELERLKNHIFFVETEEQSNSSSRDRNLLSQKIPHSLVKLLDNNAPLPNDAHRTAKALKEISSFGQWKSLQVMEEYLIGKKEDRKNYVGALREILQRQSLEILRDNDLLDLYCDRDQKTRSPIPDEVMKLAIPFSEKFALINPDHIEQLSPISAFHFARALASHHYRCKLDSVNHDIYNARMVYFLMAHTAYGRNFIPSVLIDRAKKTIAASLVAYKFRDPPMVKYTTVVIDKDYRRDSECVKNVNELVRQRITADRDGKEYENIDLMLVEAPAHDTRFIEQHILGGTKFFPCGLEPDMDSSELTIKWNVLGMHVRNMHVQQGEYYITQDVENLIRAINDLLSIEYGTSLRYTIIGSEKKGGKYDCTDGIDTPSEISEESARLLRKTSFGYEYQFGPYFFSIYPKKNHQLNANDFQDAAYGAVLLAKAINSVEKLHEQGEFGKSYILISLPINKPHALALQKILERNCFYPISFTPKTTHMSPIVTFCRILNAPAKPMMNKIELPLSKISGDPSANKIFQQLQNIGNILSHQGTVTMTQEQEDSTMVSPHILRGKQDIEHNTYADKIILIEKGRYEAFPSLFAHYFEVKRTLDVFIKNGLQIPIKEASPPDDLWKTQEHQEKFCRHFICLHDAGKAIWAMLNRFRRTILDNCGQELESEDLNNKLNIFLTRDIDTKKDPYSNDWILEKLNKFTPEEFSRFLSFNNAENKYCLAPDLAITIQLIKEFIAETGNDSNMEIYEECIRLYEFFLQGDIEDRILKINLENEADIKSLLSDYNVFYFVLLELIDNTSRYRLTDDGENISVRNVLNALELKKEEVLKRYGADEQTQRDIARKFEVLKKAAEEWFGQKNNNIVEK